MTDEGRPKSDQVEYKTRTPLGDQVEKRTVTTEHLPPERSKPRAASKAPPVKLGPKDVRPPGDHVPTVKTRTPKDRDQ